MKEPQRLLDGGASEVELSLLRAGDADGPREEARRAALAALGLTGVSLFPSAAAAATSGARLAHGARVATWKWLVLGTVTSAAFVGGGYWALRSPQAQPKAASYAPPPTQAPAAPVVTPTPSATPLTSAESPESVAERQLVPPAARVAPTASAAGIEAQIELIDRARSAASARSPRAALAALDDYQKRYPNGILVQEATLLRIESLLALGDRTSAARLGNAFLAKHPRSALAPRIRSLLGR